MLTHLFISHRLKYDVLSLFTDYYAKYVSIELDASKK